MYAKLRIKPRSYIGRNDPYYLDELKAELSYIIENYKENDFMKYEEINEEGNHYEEVGIPNVITDLFSYLEEFNEKIDFG